MSIGKDGGREGGRGAYLFGHHKEEVDDVLGLAGELLAEERVLLRKRAREGGRKRCQRRSREGGREGGREHIPGWRHRRGRC